MLPSEILLALSEEMLGTVGFDGRVQTVNPAWEKTLGFSRRELEGLPLLDVILPEDRDAARRALSRVASVDGSEVALTNRCRCRNGSIKKLRWRLTASPAAAVFCVAAREESALAPLDARLPSSQTMTQIGRMALGVAHDFNNILACIQGCASLLEPKGPDVEDILDATQRASELVKLLIELVQDRKPSQDLDANLGEVVARMERLLRRVIGRSIDLDVSSEGSPGRVRIGAVRLQQVILNLAINARDAMPQGGRLQLKTASATEGFALLLVSDNGVGMRPEVQARMFDPFFSTKEGSGIGLATVHEIVQDCGGRISVESRPGDGTAVKIFLPRLAAPLV